MYYTRLPSRIDLDSSLGASERHNSSRRGELNVFDYVDVTGRSEDEIAQVMVILSIMSGLPIRGGLQYSGSVYVSPYDIDTTLSTDGNVCERNITSEITPYVVKPLNKKGMEVPLIVKDWSVFLVLALLTVVTIPFSSGLASVLGTLSLVVGVCSFVFSVISGIEGRYDKRSSTASKCLNSDKLKKSIEEHTDAWKVHAEYEGVGWRELRNILCVR